MVLQYIKTWDQGHSIERTLCTVKHVFKIRSRFLRMVSPSSSSLMLKSCWYDDWLAQFSLISHTSDFLPCREQLWDKFISHGFHDLQLYTLRHFNQAKYTVQSMREHAFCMVFHARWIFLTKTRVGFWDEWWEINLTWKTIQNAYRLSCFGLYV